MNLDTVLGAIAEFGRAYDRYRRSHEAARLQYEEAIASWLGECSDLILDLVRAGEDEAEVRDALTSFLITGDEGDLPEREELDLDLLHDARPAHLNMVRERLSKMRASERELRGHQRKMWAYLTRWRMEAGEEAGEEFPDVLNEWTVAVGKTSRQAAESLGVSASAIVRYLNDQRTPSRPHLAAMVERMSALDAVVIPDSPLRQLAHPSGAEAGVAALLEDMESDESELREQIEVAADRLGGRHLRALAALAQDIDALDALLDWADRYGDEPLRPVLDAFVDNGVRPHLDDEEVPW